MLFVNVERLGGPLLQRLAGGVGQEEAHEAATGEQHGHDEGRRGAVRVQQRGDHHVADDAAQPRRHHRYRDTRGSANWKEHI